jgi:hypothetical protein
MRLKFTYGIGCARLSVPLFSYVLSLIKAPAAKVRPAPQYEPPLPLMGVFGLFFFEYEHG